MEYYDIDLSVDLRYICSAMIDFVVVNPIERTLSHDLWKHNIQTELWGYKVLGWGTS